MLSDCAGISSPVWKGYSSLVEDTETRTSDTWNFLAQNKQPFLLTLLQDAETPATDTRALLAQHSFCGRVQMQVTSHCATRGVRGHSKQVSRQVGASTAAHDV